MRFAISGVEQAPLLSPVTAIELPEGSEFSMKLAQGGRWWGHGFSHLQHAPLDAGRLLAPHFAVNNIQVPMWIGTGGIVLFADTMRPLAVQIADGCLRLAGTEGAVTLRVWRGDPREGVRACLAERGWPPPAPAEPILADPFWCTWTQWPRCIDQAKVIGLAEQIRQRNWPCSTIIIDDRWENRFGELAFGPAFPDPRAMVDRLHALGFAVWLWVTPFVNREAATFGQLGECGALVRSRSHPGAAMLKWWGGEAGLVDVTGAAGRDWLTGRLRDLRSTYGIDGFKIDGGDAKYQPPVADCCWAEDPGACGYSDRLLSLFAEMSPGACETRTAWLSQHRPILWRQGGKDSHWGADNGLRAMVALGLNLAVCGYDLLIPDMVPGRVQTMVSTMALPSDELMVRWTEASALFPSLQFSYLPWNYASATAEACRGWALLHRDLGEYLAAAARDRHQPLMRPLWWEAPGDPELAQCGDEWLLGPDLLAAPVLDAGQTVRDVLLPPGRWLDAWTGDLHEGLLVRHPAPCPGMPLFVRQANTALHTTVAAALARLQRGSVPLGITTATWQAGLDRDLSVTG